MEDINVTSGSVEATVPTLDDAKTTVNFSVKLTNPGDFYEFTVKEVNAGTIDAMISKISKTGLTTSKAKYLDYTVTYSDGTTLAEKQLLKSNQSETLKVRIDFKKDITAADLPTIDTTLNLNFSLSYKQSDDSALGIIPKNYTRISYLYNDNTYAYINPNYMNDISKNVKIILDAQIDNIERNKNTYMGGNLHFQILLTSSGAFRISNSDKIINTIYNDGERHIFIQTAYNMKSDLYVDQNQVSSITWNKNMLSYQGPYLLFAMSNSMSSPTPYNAKVMFMKVYSCKIYEDDVLVRALIPVLDDKNQPCMYDYINKRTYYNSGSGEFKYK